MFSDRLKKLREQYNLTEMQLAQSVGLAYDDIVAWEKETKPIPQFPTLLRLTRYFNVSLDYLLGFGEIPGPGVPPLPIDEDTGLPFFPIKNSTPHTFPVPPEESEEAMNIPPELLRILSSLSDRELDHVQKYVNKLIDERNDVYMVF